MPHSQLLPPPPPPAVNYDKAGFDLAALVRAPSRPMEPVPSLSELAELTRTKSAPPPPSHAVELDPILDLVSWAPQATSVLSPSSEPPDAGSRGVRIAAITTIAMAVVAVCTAAVVTWSRTSVAEATAVAPRAPAQITAPLAQTVAAIEASQLRARDVVAPSRPIVDAPAATHASPAPVERARVQLTERHVQEPAVAERSAEVTARATAVALPAAVVAPPPAPIQTAQATDPTPADALPAAELPEVPPREAVVAAMDSVHDAVQTCAAARHGAAPVTITVASNGRVRNAVVAGAFVGTPEGSCIARAVRAAHFPAFTRPSLEISYPFAF